MIFDFTSKKLISYDQESSSENLRENFDVFIKGLISLPLNFSGTAHHKCRQVEHEGILKKRDKADSGLTWAEYKSMTFTFQFNAATRKCSSVDISRSIEGCLSIRV
ncbi:cytochrome P450 87A3-like [Cucurbita maxima]|uniref:Cytochrome P450 87A3-like n=1 Tax=Cucurbita maxima TaxID=3661 RepID=A0A6J1HNA3_CUCMA|nr:cytochrome P450 87A3-like [Cucurbita maxima]